MNTYSHYGDIDTAARRPSVSDEERAELRASVRDFFVKHTSPSQIVHWLETDPGYDPAVLTAIYTQLALPAIRIPERFGGMGYGWQELGVVLEETGRALTGVPFLSGQIAAAALLELGDEEGRSRVLSGLASGANRCTVAGLSERGPLSFGVRAEPADSPEVSWSLDGTARFVIDGAGADTILVLAETRSGPALFMPASPAPGMLRRPLVTMDMTRPMADIEFNAVPAVPLGEVSPAWRAPRGCPCGPRSCCPRSSSAGREAPSGRLSITSVSGCSSDAPWDPSRRSSIAAPISSWRCEAPRPS